MRAIPCSFTPGSNANAYRWVANWLLVTLLAFSTSTTVVAASGSFTASENHGLTLNADGSVCAVGQNEYGELGDGTSVNQTTLEKLSEFAGAKFVSTGWYHTVAVKTDGTVWAWGHNGNGQLGDGTTVDKPTPNQVPGLTNMIAVAAGKDFSLAIKSDGTVWGWGDNDYGELGDGSGNENNRPSPVQTVIISGIIAVAAGNAHSLALTSNGTVWAWGANYHGQLGDGTTTLRYSPVQVANLSGVIAIAAGDNYSLALKSDGTVWAWGYNGDGELGDGNNNDSSNIVQVGAGTPLTGVIAIAAGDGHSLAAKSDGTAWAWGKNGNGELGDGTITSRNVPVQVNGLSGGTNVAAGVAHSAALKSDGSVWSWGNNTYGQLGTGNTVPSLTPVASLPCASIPPASGRSYSSGRLKASENHSMAIRNDGTVWAWGENTNGELGDGTTTDRSSPVQAGSLTGVTDIAAGWYHSLAARSDGTVWAWGHNGNGQLGDGTTVDKLTPNQVPGLTNMIAVAAGQDFSLAIKSDGTVWGWGDNDYGELGDGNGNENNRPRPVQTVIVSSVIAVAAGNAHGLALESNGTVWAWGANYHGQLGDGTTDLRYSPVQVANLSGVIAIAAAGNYSYSLALKSDGTVWAWGYNGDGELGDGTTTDRSEIVRVSGLTDIVAIAAGDTHGLAVRSDGTVWAWGDNTYGELGDGTVTSQNQPVQVNGLTDAVAVAAGASHSLALKSDGTIWAWGLNNHGQFGEALPASSEVPTKAVAAGIGGVATLTLSVSPAGGGAVDASPPSPDGVYPTGTTVCLTAAPNAGYVFNNYWTGTALDGSNCLVMNGDAAVTANFNTTTAQFSDVPPSATFFDAADLMFSQGVTTGCVQSSDPATRQYCPDDDVTRQEMAAFIVRAVTGTVNPSIYNTTPYFNDVTASNNNFFPHIQKMMELGITTGCSQNPPLFCPTDTIPRWEMAIFMIRARLMLQGATFTTSQTPYFADVPTNVEGNGQPFPFIQRAYEEHVTNGCGTNPLVYCPDELVTRGQMASFIMRGLFNETTILGPTAPQVTGVSPNAVAATTGSQIMVTITGANTSFQAGDTVTVPSGMLTVSNVVVNSATSISATLTVNSTAVAGPQALVVSSGGQNLTLPLAIKVGTY
ncbi:MAG: hypothetical protein ABSF98_16485 [Bryobacteraceae bacterium]